MLLLGPHDNLSQQLSPSFRPEMSKQVPRSPPRTGFFGCLIHPAVVSVGGVSALSARTQANNNSPTRGTISVFIGWLRRPTFVKVSRFDFWHCIGSVRRGSGVRRALHWLWLGSLSVVRRLKNEASRQSSRRPRSPGGQCCLRWGKTARRPDPESE